MKLNLSRKDQTSKMDKNYEGRKRMTRILFGIVGVFMVCHTPCVVWKILWHLGCIGCTAKEDSEFKRKWFFITPIKKLFLIMNSSLNFIIYCIMGSKFRVEFYRLICLKNHK